MPHTTCLCCERGPMVPASSPGRVPVRKAAFGLCSRCYQNRYRGGRCKHEVDSVVVERLIDGDPTPASYSERAAAIGYGLQRGWSASRIAEHLRISTRTVDRYRAQLRQLQIA